MFVKTITMRKLMTLLFLSAVLVSCSSIDSSKYHYEIQAAHKGLLENYEQFYKTFNEQTGKPEATGIIEEQIAAFSVHTDSLITKIQGIEKLEDDAFKAAFVTYANGIKGIVNTEYKARMPFQTVKDEDFTKEMQTQEAAIINTTNKKLDGLDEMFRKKQKEFAKKYNIILY